MEKIKERRNLKNRKKIKTVHDPEIRSIRRRI